MRKIVQIVMLVEMASENSKSTHVDRSGQKGNRTKNVH